MGPAALSFTDGILVVNNPRVAILVAELALRETSDSTFRQGLLSFSTLCAQYILGTPQTPVWAPPTAPSDLVERMAILTAIMGLQRGDESHLASLAAYIGLADLRERDGLAAMLYHPRRRFLDAVRETSSPMRYLAAALQRRLSRCDRQTAQQHMVDLDIDIEPIAIAAEAATGIDCQDFLATLRASNKPGDLELARDIEEWLSGVPKRVMGDSRYQRVLYHLRQPRVRAIANRTSVTLPRTAVCGVMAAPNWFYTRPGRRDSVWHRQNRRMIR
jgi:hypothetical protein